MVDTAKPTEQLRLVVELLQELQQHSVLMGKGFTLRGNRWAVSGPGQLLPNILVCLPQLCRFAVEVVSPQRLN